LGLQIEATEADQDSVNYNTIRRAMTIFVLSRVGLMLWVMLWVMVVFFLSMIALHVKVIIILLLQQNQSFTGNR
jgi:hypothetical protein